MKKLVLTLMVVLLLSTIVAGAASAQDGTTFVRPASDGATYTVPAGDDIVLRWGWLAKNKGLVQMFQKAWTAGYTIYDADGNPVFAISAGDDAQFWQPISSAPASDSGLDCPGGLVWRSQWMAPVTPPLPCPGTYTLVTEWTQRHPVNDALHTCTDIDTGLPIVETPNLIPARSGTWTVTIEQQ